MASSGSTGKLLGRSLIGLRDLIDRSLAAVRVEAGEAHLEPIQLAGFVDDLGVGAMIQARTLDFRLGLTSVEPSVIIEADRAILGGAILNLLQNAFKFTRPKSYVSLEVSVSADRVLFEVQDECGGLPPGAVEDLFRPYSQRGRDRTGVGLGLTICLRAAKLHHGDLRVRDLPGNGCVFSLEIPRVQPKRIDGVDGG